MTKYRIKLYEKEKDRIIFDTLEVPDDITPDQLELLRQDPTVEVIEIFNNENQEVKK